MCCREVPKQNLKWEKTAGYQVEIVTKWRVQMCSSVKLTIPVRVREILERPASVETPAPLPLTSMAAEGHDVWALAGDAPATSDVIPARSAKEPRPAARPGGRSATRASAMARILETDALRIDVMLSRWRQALAGADGDERRSFALYLRNHLEPQLAALRLAVEDDEIGEDSAARGRV